MGALDASFPRKRCSAGAIIRDTAKRILIVKPCYREGWLLPGGIVEALESPIEALCREVRDETGFTPTPVSLACIDYLTPADGFGEAIHFLFVCQDIAAEEAQALLPDGKEITQLHFASATEAEELVVPAISRRMKTVLTGQSGYFHNGCHSLSFMQYAD
jgi:8-oxo-dGTP pyrophosphatase MutT (NUDIX family)